MSRLQKKSMKFTVKQEGKFKYIEEGKGRPIIILHGLMGGLSNFNDFINFFRKKGYKVLMPMLPIYELPVLDSSVKNLAKFLYEFVKFKGLENYNCCGIIAACTSPETVTLILPEFKKTNLPYGFKVNAFKNIPENNHLDADLYDNGYPTERYGTRANEFNPEVFKKFVQNKLKDGATLLGGCCEIKPRHIKALTK